MVGVHTFTGGLPGSNPLLACLTYCVLGHRHQPCLLMVVRRPGGTSIWQPHFCHTAHGSCGNNVAYHH